MAFVDVRMPPGWDGIETTARIWEQDPDLQIVICTAYSDYSWSEMVAKLGRSDRLVILKKPFDTIEVLQLASALSEKWRLARQSRSMLADLEGAVAERTREVMQSVDELRRSESLKSAILESSLDCVITIDGEGKIVEFNPAAETTFGLTRGDALGKEMVELIVPPRLRDAHRRGFAHYFATGEGPILGKRLELEAIRADGTEFPIELAITAITAAPTTMFTGFIRDITERKKIEEEIRATKTFLASMFDNIPNSIFVKDAKDLRYVRMNPAGQKLMGFSEQELLGKNDHDFFPKDEADFFVAKDRETLSSHEHLFVFEETVTAKDGTRKILQTKKFPILDKDGHPQYLLGMSEDITERKQTEARIRESEAKYRGLIEQASDGIFITDAEGNYQLVNSRACEQLGFTESEMIGMHGSLTHLEGDRGTSRLQSLAGGGLLRYERMMKRKDGSVFPADVSARKLDDASVQVIFRDVTDRKEAESRIQRLNRMYTMLSGINSAIVRIRDRQELLNEACRIAAMHGAFRLAWFGLLNQATGEMDLVASAGFDDGFFDKATHAAPKGALGPRGVGTRAFHERRTFIDNDIVANSDINLIRRAAVNLGCRSVIGLPLSVAGVTAGSFILYAKEKDFFDEEEVKLLEELAGDISFALTFIAQQEKVEYLAYYDALTGLANRSLFLERVAQYMRSATSGGHKLALFLFDLERFKNINDSLGRPAGDTLLKQVAQWLTLNLGDANLFARVDADHFAHCAAGDKAGGRRSAASREIDWGVFGAPVPAERRGVPHRGQGRRSAFSR